MRLLLLASVAAGVVGLGACGDDPLRCRVDRGAVAFCNGDLFDASDGPIEHLCNPLTQTGCQAGQKCTWVIDQTIPLYAGGIDCAPDGTAQVGSACEYGAAGATGYDNCVKGAVCSTFAHTGQPGICKPICDNGGGNPMCDATHACVAEPGLFSTGTSSPAAAGLCEVACDPLADNDFDGSGSALSRTGSACGSDPQIGCYGQPSVGTPPRTAFTCMSELNYTAQLHHRTECTTDTGCDAGNGLTEINSCNQGYEPLFRESTAVSTAVCIAMCKPLDCYAGHCGSNDANRAGAAPHRCANPDAVGSFGSGEECEYLWSEELDGSSTWLPSPYSDEVGFCFDHSQYKYDPSGGTNPTIPYPPCEQLQLHATGSDPSDPLTFFGAVDFGCVSSQTAGLPAQRRPLRALPRRWR